jgi:hypothetical protein
VEGIGVLLDFHALPGGANPHEHSGTNSNRADLWDSPTNKKLALVCLEYMARQITQERLHGVIGLQVCNESESWAPDRGMYEFYDQSVSVIGAADPTLPIYISDAWNLERALDYATRKNVLQAVGQPPMVVDTHIYFCFSDIDKARSPQAIIQEASNKLSELDSRAGSVVDRGAAEVIVGEYSCVLDESTWNRRGSASREDLVKQFGQAQSRRYQTMAGGAFFWTYKMDWLPGGEWGFLAMTDQRAVIPPPHLSFSLQEAQQSADQAQSLKDGLLRNDLDAHVNYWRQFPSQDYQHERYEEGWKHGWADAEAFWRSNLGPQKIGLMDLWVLKRCREYSGGTKLKALWEWEQGFRKGVKNFQQSVNR